MNKLFVLSADEAMVNLEEQHKSELFCNGADHLKNRLKINNFYLILIQYLIHIAVQHYLDKKLIT